MLRGLTSQQILSQQAGDKVYLCIALANPALWNLTAAKTELILSIFDKNGIIAADSN